jgi:biotin carboxyl carrier protein
VEHRFVYRGEDVSVTTATVDAHTITVTVNGEDHTVRVLRHDGARLVFEMDGNIIDTTHAESDAGVEVAYRGRRYVLADPDAELAGGVGAAAASDGILRTPMPGKIVDVHVSAGDRVEAGERLLVLESMKMQNDVIAPYASEVVAVHHEPGDNVDFGDVLVELRPPEGD